MSHIKDLTPEEITALLQQLSENESEGSNLSENDDESEEIMYKSKIKEYQKGLSLDSYIN